MTLSTIRETKGDERGLGGLGWGGDANVRQLHTWSEYRVIRQGNTGRGQGGDDNVGQSAAHVVRKYRVAGGWGGGVVGWGCRSVAHTVREIQGDGAGRVGWREVGMRTYVSQLHKCEGQTVQ